MDLEPDDKLGDNPEEGDRGIEVYVMHPRSCTVDWEKVSQDVRRIIEEQEDW